MTGLTKYRYSDIRSIDMKSPRKTADAGGQLEMTLVGRTFAARFMGMRNAHEELAEHRKRINECVLPENGDSGSVIPIDATRAAIEKINETYGCNISVEVAVARANRASDERNVQPRLL